MTSHTTKQQFNDQSVQTSENSNNCIETVQNTEHCDRGTSTAMELPIAEASLDIKHIGLLDDIIKSVDSFELTENQRYVVNYTL